MEKNVAWTKMELAEIERIEKALGIPAIFREFSPETLREIAASQRLVDHRPAAGKCAGSR